MASVNVTIWGDENTWQHGMPYLDPNNTIWFADDQHKLSDIYSELTGSLEINDPIDTTPAFWGWKNDCSWSTWHCRSIINAVQQDVNTSPSEAIPVMGWAYNNTSGYPNHQILPRCRVAYEVVTDASYDRTYAVGGLALGGYWYSRAWLDLDYSGFCTCPQIDYYKIDNGEFKILSEQAGSPTRDLSTIRTYLAQGWHPISVNMDGIVSGDATGTTSRTEVGMWDGMMGQISGMGDVRLTSDLIAYYKQEEDPTDIAGHRLCLNPATTLDVVYMPVQIPWGNNTILNATAYNSSVGYGKYQQVGGHAKKEIVQYKVNPNVWYSRWTSNRQDFTADDGVVYHWEFKSCGDDGQPINMSATSGYAHWYTELVIDNKPASMTDDEALERAILHECAFFGTKFAATSALNTTADLTSNGDGIGLYIPVFDENYVTTGLYHTGQDYLDDDNVDTDSARDFDFNPTPAPDPGGGEEIPYGDTGDWRYNFHNFEVVNNDQYYVLTPTEFAKFVEFCQGNYWTTEVDPADPNNTRQVIHSNLEFNSVDFSHWITCVKQYPFQLPITNTQQPIKIGFIEAKWDDEGTERILGAPLYKYNTDDCTYDLGSFTLDDNFLPSKDFRSTALARVFLRLPFYGDFELDLAKYFNKNINIKLTVDFVTGCGCYMILANGTLFDCIDVQIGMSLPMTSFDMGTYQDTMQRYDLTEHQARQARTANVLGGIITAIGGAALGGDASRGMSQALTGAISGTMEIEQTQFNLGHTIPKGVAASTASPFCAMNRDLQVRVITMTPMETIGFGGNGDYSKRPYYAKTVGYACVKSGKLSDFSGLTVCGGANLDKISCTETERSMIANFLQGGVIV